GLLRPTRGPLRIDMRDGISFRVCTYNAHSCRGMDRRTRPDRIAAVLRETEAGIIALQEIWRAEEEHEEREQLRAIGGEHGLRYCFGGNWSCAGGVYGNAILRRWPLHTVCSYDLWVDGRERRGCIRADIEVEEAVTPHI